MRNKSATTFFLAILSVLAFSQEPIHLDPDNPHYFLWKGKPTVLITSGEHYGSVINLDFNYRLYLETLNKLGLNHTRIFLGDYIEPKHAFCIGKNTLSPAAGKIYCTMETEQCAGLFTWWKQVQPRHMGYRLFQTSSRFHVICG